MIFRRQIQLLIALFIFIPPGLSAATYKIATVSPDGLSWMKKMRAGTKEIKEKTDGRVKFKIYPGGVQGDDDTVLRKMRIGQLHGGVVAAGSLTRFYPDLQIYNLPLQFRDGEEVEHIRTEMDQMIADGLFDAGISTFTFTETGFAYLMTKTPVSSVAELKTVKAWIPEGDPIAAELVNAFGVSPIPLNLTDVLAGLQTGLINAVVAPPTVALALQWHNHVNYLTELPLVYIYSMLAMDKKAFGRMSDEDQVVVKSVMNRIFSEVEADNRMDNERAMQALSRIGIKTVPVPAGSLNEWQDVADRSVQSLIQSGEITPQAVELYLSNLKAYRHSQDETSGSD